MKGGAFMSDNELSQDWLKKNGHKLKIVYSYAVVNKLDVKSKKDVLKVLQATDPENANDEQAEIYSKMLQLFGKKLKEAIAKKLEN